MMIDAEDYVSISPNGLATEGILIVDILIAFMYLNCLMANGSETFFGFAVWVANKRVAYVRERNRKD
jgi:hypothetical protein